MKKVAVALVLICFGIGMLSAEGEKNFIKVGGALEMRENSAGIAISTSVAGYSGTSEISGLELPDGDHHISLSFKNMNVREIIRILGRTAKFNVVACRSVTGNIEQVKMTDVEWPVALASLADSTGYQTRLQDDIVFVGTPADFALLAAPEAGAPSSQENISLSFKDAALADILKVATARRQNASIIMSKTVEGNFSISLTDVSEAVAVRAIARANGHDCMYYDDVWFVTSPAIISSLREKQLSVPAGPAAGNISLDFRNTDIRAIFSILAQKGNLKIDPAENVQGRVTVKIVDQPPAKVTSYLAWCNGYEVVPTADVLQIR
jgi:hypothetical protein